jgi:hypothetical protein
VNPTLSTVLQSERSSVFIFPVRTFLWDWSYATGFTRGLDICSNVISCGPERSSTATYLKMRLRFLEKMKGVRRNQCRKIHWEGFSRRVSRLTAIIGGWVMGGKEIKFIGPTESSFRPIYGRRCCNGLNWAWFGLGYPIGPVNLICSYSVNAFYEWLWICLRCVCYLLCVFIWALLTGNLGPFIWYNYWTKQNKHKVGTTCLYIRRVRVRLMDQDPLNYLFEFERLQIDNYKRSLIKIIWLKGPFECWIRILFEFTVRITMFDFVW